MATILDPYAPTGPKNRQFIITELQATSNGFIDAPTKFTWDASTQSSPRNSWEIGVKLRTVREDYPGTDKPTEQVLGFNYEPFTLEGYWDDRYAGAQFAENTHKVFEAMVLRGNLCRFEFERLAIHGIITEFKPKYEKSYRIGYSFTVSPHFKNKDGDLRAARNSKQQAPEALANPNRYVERVTAIVTAAVEAMAVAPKEFVTGDTYDTIAASVSDWTDTVDRISTIVDAQVLSISDAPQNSLASVVQRFASLRASAAALLLLTPTLRSDTDLSFESALGNLAFDAWHRNLSASARALLLEADTATKELGKRITPDALALYRPRAGESLYAISNRFFKTPHKWRLVATRNNLHTFTLTGTELLTIPRA